MLGWGYGPKVNPYKIANPFVIASKWTTMHNLLKPLIELPTGTVIFIR